MRKGTFAHYNRGIILPGASCYPGRGSMSSPDLADGLSEGDSSGAPSRTGPIGTPVSGHWSC